jgi:hypothetical protein
MISKGCEGMIFVLPDKCNNRGVSSQHNYIILNDIDNRNNLNLLQGMSISSMYNKTIKNEVPILLMNNMISYVIPYNIHSFLIDEIKLNDFKGSVNDSELISRSDFLKMLLDMYVCELNLPSTPKSFVDDTMDRYHRYCNSFWRLYGNYVEYRDFKVDKSLYEKTMTVATKEATVETRYDSSIKNVLPFEVSTKIPSVKKRRSQYNSKRYTKRSKKLINRKMERLEEKEINEDINYYLCQ